METLVSALALLADPWVITVILLSAALGLFVGAMPGLTAAMAVALLVPVTLYMEPVPALAMIATLSCMAIFAGDIPKFQVIIPDFGVVEGGFQITSIEYSGKYDGEAVYELSMSSASALDFTAI